MKLRFNVRAVLWLTLLAAILAGWLADHRRLKLGAAEARAAAAKARMEAAAFRTEHYRQQLSLLRGQARRRAEVKRQEDAWQ